MSPAQRRLAVMEEIARRIPGVGRRQLTETADAILARLSAGSRA